MKPWHLLMVWLCAWNGVFAESTDAPLLYIASPEVRNLPSEGAEAVGHALRFHLQQTQRFRILPADSAFSSAHAPGLWELHWSVTRMDSLLFLKLHLQAPKSDGAGERRVQSSWIHGHSYYLPAKNTIRSLLDSSITPVPQILPEKKYHPWVAGLVWGGFAGVAFWQQKSVASPSRVLPSSAGKGSSEIAALFAGTPPLPSLRGSAGAGSAQYGQSKSHFLNPAGVVHTPDQLELAAGRLPGGTTETGVVFTGSLGHGWWQAHSIRFEGDSLARAWLFASSLASDLGYWFSGLQGVYAGVNVKGSSMATGDAGSASAVSGNGIGWGMDAGVQWGLGRPVRMGFSLLDVLAMDRWHNRTTAQRYWERRPVRCVAGLAWLSPYDATLLLDWFQGVGSEEQEEIALAVERSVLSHFVWRAGYRYALSGNEDSWHAGLGAHMNAGGIALHVEYAIEAPGQSGRFSAVRQTAGTRLTF